MDTQVSSGHVMDLCLGYPFETVESLAMLKYSETTRSYQGAVFLVSTNFCRAFWSFLLSSFNKLQASSPARLYIFFNCLWLTVIAIKSKLSLSTIRFNISSALSPCTRLINWRCGSPPIGPPPIKVSTLRTAGCSRWPNS